MYPLGWTFFALSSDYGKHLIEEYYLMSKILRTQYSEFLKIPTYIRKYIIDRIIEDNTPKT
jgi:hypothetical protein